MTVEKMLRMVVNGAEVCLPRLPDESLADFLRNRMGLTGTKIGCEEAECGACTVLVNSDPVLSCSYPAARAEGMEILTIEGLEDPSSTPEAEGGLHPLQQAFIQHGAVQCGFCTPGQIMSAFSLLQRHPDPTSVEIRRALKGNLCRCGSYPAIERAVLAAARALHSGVAIQPPLAECDKPGAQAIGRRLIRPDAVQKVTGRGLYTADLNFEGSLHARVKRAGVPHAILRRLDVTRARALPGIAAVLTAEDIPGEHYHGLVTADWPILVGVGERVRYVGDAIAIVAAETREIASKALDLIEVEFELQPVVNSPLEALSPQAPQLHKTGNLLKHIQVRKGNVETGFAEADAVIEHTFNTPALDHLFMEPECSLARPLPEGRMEVYVGSQIPYSDREQVARALGWPLERVRIIGQLVGGAFGGKEDIAGQIHAALLAHATGRPVKLLFDRKESMLVHPKRHATQIRIKMGAKQDGVLTAVETELYGDTGAYASLGEKVMERATTHSTGPYAIPHVKADCYAVYTNNPPAGAFRGFGVTQAHFAVESMMDMLAERLGMDPVELRRKNALDVGKVTGAGQLLTESVGLMECIERVDTEMRKRAGSRPFLPRTVRDQAHIRTAWGFAVAFKNTGFGGGAVDKASAEVELFPDGTLEVRTSSAELGQGLTTVLQMIAAEELSVPASRIRVLVMDTDLTPDGGATTSSRQTYVSGNAVCLAARKLRQDIADCVTQKFEMEAKQVSFADGRVQAGNRDLSLVQIWHLLQENGRSPCAQSEYCAPATRALGEGGDLHFAYSFAAQAAEVAVNLRTGEVNVLQVIAANDVGKALNPLGLLGQVEGGVIMGIGNALIEKFITEDGYIFTDRMARSRMPSILHVPQITCFFVEHSAHAGPYGAKGVGEIVNVPTAAAITNAINHAVGVRIDNLPVDQEEIWRCVSQDLG